MALIDTLSWFIFTTQPLGCVVTNHLGDFLVRVFAQKIVQVCEKISISGNTAQKRWNHIRIRIRIHGKVFSQ